MGEQNYIMKTFIWETMSLLGRVDRFINSRVKILGDYVMFGPNVIAITGGHKTDIVGRKMSTNSNNEKLPENDQDIIFEGDNWIGANSTILRGTRIGIGVIIAAGAVVIKDVEL